MKARLGIVTVALFLPLGIIGWISVPGRVAKAPKIEGSYRLVSRDLPDGTKQVPPDVGGLLTYTKEYRNLNVYWRDAAGKVSSVSDVATYKLTEKEYSERGIYHLENDEIGAKPPVYDLSGPTGSSPVSITGSRIAMDLPLHGEPSIVFEGDKFTATRKGVFVDHWEKVR
jgi:hypothetical protein